MDATESKLTEGERASMVLLGLILQSSNVQLGGGGLYILFPTFHRFYR